MVWLGRESPSSMVPAAGVSTCLLLHTEYHSRCPRRPNGQSLPLPGTLSHNSCAGSGNEPELIGDSLIGHGTSFELQVKQRRAVLKPRLGIVDSAELVSKLLIQPLFRRDGM